MSAEVRFTTDEQFMKTLQSRFAGEPRVTEIAREALTILNWAVSEIASGRVILSTDKAGGDVHRLVTPLLTQVRGASPSTQREGA